MSNKDSSFLQAARLHQVDKKEKGGGGGKKGRTKPHFRLFQRSRNQEEERGKKEEGDEWRGWFTPLRTLQKVLRLREKWREKGKGKKGRRKENGKGKGLIRQGIY